jgi:hypothetical protein
VTYCHEQAARSNTVILKIDPNLKEKKERRKSSKILVRREEGVSVGALFNHNSCDLIHVTFIYYVLLVLFIGVSSSYEHTEN